MSIQTEINRISGNVANALTAIANKGVTVPAGSNSDNLADLIGQISGGITPTGNINISQAGVTDVTNYATATVPYADANGSVGGNFITVSNVLKYRISGEAYAESGGWVDGDSGVGTVAIQDLSAIPRNTTITPTTSAQTIGDRETVLEGPVTIAAMPSGTAGTPTATKGTVSNHSVTITPSVTNTTGYITGGTKTGTAVTVQASELVSGSETKTANGTYDVTNLASLVVAVPIVTYYTSSQAPTSADGVNGDIWLQT